jgi:hypothetical protein
VKRTLGIELLVAGVLVPIGSLGADALGIGAEVGFGRERASFTAVGVVFVGGF